MMIVHFLIALCCYLNVHSIYAHNETRRLLTDITGHLTDDDKDAIVTYHNTKRAALSTADSLKLKNDIYAPKPEPALHPLTWSVELEYVATYLIDDCWYGHRDAPRSDAWLAITGSRFSLGENIATNGYPPDRSLQEALDGWWDEYQIYTWAPLTMGDPDFTKIGHFRQMISQFTTHIGCASRYCPHGAYFDGVLDERFTFLLYCNYYPGGNRVGYFPYNNERLPRVKSFEDVKQIQLENSIGDAEIENLFKTLKTDGTKSFYKCLPLPEKANYFRCWISCLVNKEEFFENEHFAQFLKVNYGWKLHKITIEPKLNERNQWVVVGQLREPGSVKKMTRTGKKKKLPPLKTSSGSGTKSMTGKKTKSYVLKRPVKTASASGTPMRKGTKLVLPKERKCEIKKSRFKCTFSCDSGLKPSEWRELYFKRFMAQEYPSIKVETVGTTINWCKVKDYFTIGGTVRSLHTAKQALWNVYNDGNEAMDYVYDDNILFLQSVMVWLLSFNVVLIIIVCGLCCCLILFVSKEIVGFVMKAKRRKFSRTFNQIAVSSD